MRKQILPYSAKIIQSKSDLVSCHDCAWLDMFKFFPIKQEPNSTSLYFCSMAEKMTHDISDIKYKDATNTTLIDTYDLIHFT